MKFLKHKFILPITVFFMLMAVVAAAIMYVMWNALISFIKSVLVEVDFRVTG